MEILTDYLQSGEGVVSQDLDFGMSALGSGALRQLAKEAEAHEALAGTSHVPALSRALLAFAEALDARARAAEGELVQQGRLEPPGEGEATTDSLQEKGEVLAAIALIVADGVGVDDLLEGGVKKAARVGVKGARGGGEPTCSKRRPLYA